MKREWNVWLGPMLGLAAVIFAGVALRANTFAGHGRYVAKLPDFKLKDPADKEHTDESFALRGGVIIVTIPNVKHGDRQGRWCRWLKKKHWPEKGPAFILVEDMSQTRFKAKALKRMKAKYKPGTLPVLLLDPKGDVRRRFRISNDETVLMVFDRTGRITYVNDEKPTIEEARKIRRMVEKMRPAARAKAPLKPPLVSVSVQPASR